MCTLAYPHPALGTGAPRDLERTPCRHSCRAENSQEGSYRNRRKTPNWPGCAYATLKCPISCPTMAKWCPIHDRIVSHLVSRLDEMVSHPVGRSDCEIMPCLRLSWYPLGRGRSGAGTPDVCPTITCRTDGMRKSGTEAQRQTGCHGEKEPNPCTCQPPVLDVQVLLAAEGSQTVEDTEPRLTRAFAQNSGKGGWPQYMTRNAYPLVSWMMSKCSGSRNGGAPSLILARNHPRIGLSDLTG